MSAPRTVAGSLVYFIQVEGGGPVKIGRSKHLTKRLRTLQLASAFKLEKLNAIPGGPCVEDYFHAFYTDQRQQGEWFDPDTHLLRCALAGELPDADDRVASVDAYALHPDSLTEVPLTEMRRWAQIEQAICEGQDSVARIAFYADREPDDLMLDLRNMAGAGYISGDVAAAARTRPPIASSAQDAAGAREAAYQRWKSLESSPKALIEWAEQERAATT